jgi:predicted signal transduction protein with EAL and GGDEF domain
VPATARAESGRVARALTVALSAPLRLDDHTVQVGASVGVAVFPADATDVRGLLHAADVRMYEAKRTPV